jgi:hypothetical protein
MPSKSEKRKAALAPEIKELVQNAKNQMDNEIWDEDPVKHYVRRFGWLQIVKNYREQRVNDGVETPLKVLTLPSKNATDIGLLFRNGIITKGDHGKLNVAICDDTYAEMVVANLSKVGSLLAYSKKRLHLALRDDESIISQFPFDVINMDLCNPLVPEKTLENQEALKWIFKYQRGQSFLLLLTTRADNSIGNSRHLLDVLNHNLANVPSFRDAYLRRYGNLDTQSCSRDAVSFIQIVYPKIVARYGRYYGYKTVEHFTAQYKRNHFYSMACHSFEFEPLARRDPRKKYEPRIDEVLLEEENERVYGEFSPAHQIEAINAYVSYIEALPERESNRVNEILEDDDRLKRDLNRDASRLNEWWKNA